MVEGCNGRKKSFWCVGGDGRDLVGIGVGDGIRFVCIACGGGVIERICVGGLAT